ncbi:MAG: hypothetical protein AAFU67_11755 [Bacteroidota bacterium]
MFFKRKQSLALSFIVLCLALITAACNQDQALDSVVPNAGIETRMDAALTNALSKSDSTDTADYCFNFIFPIQIQLEDGTMQTANNLEDLASIDELLDSLDVDADFIYPFSVTLADGTIQTINDFDAFEELLFACFDDDDGSYEEEEDDHDEDDEHDCPDDFEFDQLYDCLQLVFPITLTDSVNTIVFNSEDELLSYLEDLDEETAESLDFVFPVQVTLTENDSLVTITNYDELEELIEECFDREDDEDGDDHDLDFDLFEEEECFTVNYPVQFTFGMETVTVNNDTELRDLVEQAYTMDIDLEVVYPVSVTLTADQSVIEITSDDDLDTVLDSCED